jgi:uncharacterized Zn finger protein
MPRAPFVHSWWADRWLRLLDELDADWQGRLSRSRTYLRDGNVRKVSVAPAMVSAEVRGSYWENYAVRLAVAPFPDRVWVQVLDALASEAGYLAQLFAGQLPKEMEALCEQVGASLFPASLAEVRQSCTCMDPVRPCKHLLALHLAFAQRLDSDPSQLLLLRGRSVEQIADLLRTLWAVKPSAAEQESVRDDTATVLRPDHYFAAPELDAFAESFTIADTPPDLDAVLILRLGKPPFAKPEEDVLAALAPVYHQLSERAVRSVKRSAWGRKGKRPATGGAS